MSDHRHRAAPAPAAAPDAGMRRYREDDAVDFVIVGTGAAGGIVAKELAEAGFRVVALEQGPWRTERDFEHDELSVIFGNALTNDPAASPGTYRKAADEAARRQQIMMYVRGVGGGSIHYAANLWRFREVDFEERSRKGPIAGAGLADWPIRYADLEPFYTKAEYDLGVSGAPGPRDAFRSRPFPLPPLPPMSAGRLLEKATAALGWSVQAAPMGILSQPYQGRAACIGCGWCWGFGCEVRAKASTLATTVPRAVATGRCEIRAGSYVRKVEHDARGRVTGVTYLDTERREHFQRAKAVVLCANGAETPRLLLLSASSLFPQGLANSSGMVGTHVMFNGGPWSFGVFPEDVNAYRGPVTARITQEPYELDREGLQGGGGYDFRLNIPPAMLALWSQPPGVKNWGRSYVDFLRNLQRRMVIAAAHTTSLPVPTNGFDLDPELKDAWGLPALRLTFREHPEDLKTYQWFQDRGKALLAAAGATTIWADPIGDEISFPPPHLLGTCRMGHDPATSVVNASHRAHDVPNLFIVDGSSFVTSGRGQPTLTIMALAYRAASEMARLARAGALGS